ncbi:ATP synthase membrane subunit DAPIT, mitochondrial [Mugil cephalus]|uniref:ATP synthase membrane subunit DAPIT, mitochondrial n=1 Tax=Mugil cephalus TaxID=48193 RepID=UPI001FB75B11|nr:ATP synthase membrane subunit DAPIT, mitochondrial [Mugil cephalus]
MHIWIAVSRRNFRANVALRPLLKDTCLSYSVGARVVLKDRKLSIMGGHDAGSHQFTGIAKYFNSYTITGRRNCVLATYATIAAIALFYKLKPKKQAAVKDK